MLAFIVTSIFFSLVAGNLLQSWTSPQCFVAEKKCPNENVTFWLYTDQTQDSPIQLDPLNLQAQDFPRRLPVKILIHGYTGHRDSSPSSHIRPVLLRHENVYVISIDYGPLVPEPCYITAVANLAVASLCLGQLINNLVSEQIVSNEDIHVIGFSLGSQVAGQTANHVENKLQRITGLDPAKPLFITAPNDEKLDASDAEFVDVVHTDVFVRGLLQSLGHVDFYPNIGQPFQPGCGLDQSSSSCSHDRAPQYYAESISTSAGFWSYACPIWPLKTFCFNKNNDALMGYFVDTNLNGTFFLQTAAQSPFALGRYDETKETAELENPDDDSFWDQNIILSNSRKFNKFSSKL